MRRENVLAVVVPNHNGGTPLRTSLEKLLAISVVEKVVLVDDRSTDGSGEIEGTDRLSVMKNHGRRGFAATSNVGIKYLLQELSPSFIAVANSDLHFDADFKRALECGVNYLASHPDTYLCGFNDAIGAKQSLTESTEVTARATSAVSGSLMLFRTSVFRRIGLMSEGYFMYGEENDYFDRMRRHRLGLVQIDSPIRHDGEGSRLPGLRTTWLAHRNALRRAIKTFEPREVAQTLGSLIVMPWLRAESTIQANLSLMRTLRFGPLAGTALGLASAGWNLLNAVTTVKERLAEDRLIEHGDASGLG